MSSFVAFLQQLSGLKNLKKQEIQRRLEQIREITGNEDTGLDTGDLDTEFDPSKHDETMASILGEDWIVLVDLTLLAVVWIVRFRF